MKTNDAPTPTGDNTAGPRKSLNYRTGPVAPGTFRETIGSDTKQTVTDVESWLVAEVVGVRVARPEDYDCIAARVRRRRVAQFAANEDDDDGPSASPPAAPPCRTPAG